MALSTTNAAVLTGATVTVGKWAAGETLDIKTVVGATFLAIGLSVMDEVAPELASKFAMLVVVIALFAYLPAIAWKAGLLDHSKYPKPPVWGGVK